MSRLKRGNHHCAQLQKDWNFFGPETFGWQVLETVETRPELIPAEQRWLDQTPSAYNAARRAGGGPRDGFRHTDESKAKMSANASRHRKGTKLPPSQIEALRLANTGRAKSPAELAGLSARLKGRVISWGRKISESKTGKPLTPEAKESYDRSRSARAAAVSQGKKGIPWSVDRWHSYALRYKA